MPVDKISRGSIMACGVCEGYAMYPADLTVSMLPAALTCPICGQQQIIDKLPVLPKVRVPGNIGYWSIESGATVEQELKLESKPNTAFEHRAETIKSLLSALIGEAQSLTEEVNQLKSAFLAEFSEQHRLCEIFKNCWDENLLSEFIINPFGILPVVCDNSNVAKNSRLILSPNFFTPNIGLKQGGMGGMRVELINPYIRIGKPIGTVLSDYLGIDKLPRITVKEDMLFGEDVAEVCEQLPGLASEIKVDTVTKLGMVAISNSMFCRMSMASLGVITWQPVPITDQMLMPRVVDYVDIVGTGAARDETQDIRNDTMAWNIFQPNGRTALFWENTANLTRCAYRLTKRFHSRKLVLCGNSGKSDVRDRWRFAFAGGGRNYDSAYIFVDSADNLPIDLINICPFVIVDAASKPEPALLKYAYNYSGPLLLIGDDPILDYATENYLAPMYYGLVNSAMFGEVSPKPFSEKAYVSKQILDALKKLNKNAS